MPTLPYNPGDAELTCAAKDPYQDYVMSLDTPPDAIAAEFRPDFSKESQAGLEGQKPLQQKELESSDEKENARLAPVDAAIASRNLLGRAEEKAVEDGAQEAQESAACEAEPKKALKESETDALRDLEERALSATDENERMHLELEWGKALLAKKEKTMRETEQAVEVKTLLLEASQKALHDCHLQAEQEKAALRNALEISEKEKALARDALKNSEKEKALARDALENSEKEKALVRDALENSEKQKALVRDALENSEKEKALARDALENSEKEKALVHDALEKSEKEKALARDALEKALETGKVQGPSLPAACGGDAAALEEAARLAELKVAADLALTAATQHGHNPLAAIAGLLDQEPEQQVHFTKLVHEVAEVMQKHVTEQNMSAEEAVASLRRKLLAQEKVPVPRRLDQFAARPPRKNRGRGRGRGKQATGDEVIDLEDQEEVAEEAPEGEPGTLQRLYNLQRIHKEVRPTSQIYLATQPAVAGKAPAPELLMRAVYLSGVSTDAFSDCITDSLDVALEEVEHAMLDPRVSKYGPTVTSRVFLHFLSEMDCSWPAQTGCFEHAAARMETVEQRITDTISSHLGHRGSEVIKLCVDEIEIKVHHKAAGGLEILRTSMSALRGGFLKPKMLKEVPDPVTGFPLRWEAAKEGAAVVQTDHPHVADHATLSVYQAKRVAARRAGSTYAYDLPGMLQLALTMKWISATGSSCHRRPCSARQMSRGT
eukprot:g8650.t1